VPEQVPRPLILFSSTKPKFGEGEVFGQVREGNPAQLWRSHIGQFWPV